MARFVVMSFVAAADGSRATPLTRPPPCPGGCNQLRTPQLAAAARPRWGGLPFTAVNECGAATWLQRPTRRPATSRTHHECDGRRLRGPSVHRRYRLFTAVNQATVGVRPSIRLCWMGGLSSRCQLAWRLSPTPSPTREHAVQRRISAQIAALRTPSRDAPIPMPRNHHRIAWRLCKCHLNTLPPALYGLVPCFRTREGPLLNPDLGTDPFTSVLTYVLTDGCWGKFTTGTTG